MEESKVSTLTTTPTPAESGGKENEERRNEMRTNLAEEVRQARAWYKNRVTGDTVAYFAAWDKAASMVLEGKKKNKVIDTLAPWGCHVSTSSGVVAGALCATAAIRKENHAHKTTNPDPG